MSKKANKFQRKPVFTPVVSFEYAMENGYTSSFVRTLSRSLQRISDDCFSRARDEVFDSRFGDSYQETKASLTEAGKINQHSSFALRNLARVLKKAGR